MVVFFAINPRHHTQFKNVRVTPSGSQEPPGQDRGYKVVDEVNKIKPTSWFDRAPEGLVGSWTLDSF